MCVENLLLIQYCYDWFMCPKYMWLYMPDAFCCRLSLFRVFTKIKKTVSTSPGLPYCLLWLSRTYPDRENQYPNRDCQRGARSLSSLFG